MVRTILTSLTFAAVLGTSISAVTPAGAQTISDTSASISVFAPGTPGGSVSKASSLSGLPVPDAVKAGVALRESLTSEQIASMNAVFASHEAEVASIAQSLQTPITNDTSLGENQGVTPSKDVTDKINASIKQLEGVNNRIEQELASVFSASQMDLYRAGMEAGEAPAIEELSAPVNQVNKGDCDASAYDATYTLFYATSAFKYSYDNYLAHGTGNAYAGYYYAYYGFTNANAAFPYLAAAAYSIKTSGADFTEGGSAGVGYAYNAYLNTKNAAVSNFADYNAKPSGDSYNAYYYSYWAYTFGYGSYTYGANGCQ